MLKKIIFFVPFFIFLFFFAVSESVYAQPVTTCTYPLLNRECVVEGEIGTCVSEGGSIFCKTPSTPTIYNCRESNEGRPCYIPGFGIGTCLPENRPTTNNPGRMVWDCFKPGEEPGPSGEDPDRPWWDIGRRSPARDLDNGPTPPQIGEIGGIVTNVMSYLFPLAGFICLIFIIQGGYMWIVSSGNPENVKKAQGTLTWAIIGLVLTMTVFGILTVIINFLY